jgi:hypothetical protein
VQITRRWQVTEQRALSAESGKAQAESSFWKLRSTRILSIRWIISIHWRNKKRLYGRCSDETLQYHALCYWRNWRRFCVFTPRTNVSDYIDLQRLRLGKNAPVDFTIQGNLKHKNCAVGINDFRRKCF